MNGSALQEFLKLKLQQKIPEVNFTGNAEKCLLALGEAIIEYIQSNAIVNSNVIVTSVTGVTTGPGISGPGTGTATGGIS
jgi:hypothetical protein